MASEANNQRSGGFKAASVPVNYERHLATAVFEQWAQLLVQTVGVSSGDAVLDVASGTGVVARRAAHAAGREGRAVAADVSEAMLAQSASHATAPGAAEIEFVTASASDLPVPGESFDAVLCQHGLQFFADRPAAIAEMRRVLRPGGVLGVAVWAAGHRLQPFDDYAEALAGAGVDPPFPGAYENASFTMDPEEFAILLGGPGWTGVEITTVELPVAWPDATAAASGILGTPFGPLVLALPDADRAGLFDELELRFAPGADATVRRTTVSVVARAVASVS